LSQGVAYGQIVSSILLSQDSIKIGGQVDIYYSLKLPHPDLIGSIDYAEYDTLKPMVGMGSITETEEQQADIDWQVPLDSKRTIDQSKIVKEGNRYSYNDTLRAVFWDPGVYVLGHPSIILKNGTPANIQELEVSPLFVEFPNIVNQDTTQQILPIAPIIEEPRTWEDFIWILYILIPLLIIGLLVWYIIRSKQAPQPKLTTIIKKPAHIIASDKLSTLRQQALWETGEIKKYQTELTYIIREYLENRFDIKALESTTDQIVKSLKDKDFSLSHENSLREILQMADLVKFAKANPPADLHESFLNTAEGFVNDTKDPNSREEVIVMDEQGNIIETNTESSDG
jgi:hypothetical protein